MANGCDPINDTLNKRESLFQGILAISCRQLEFCQEEDLDSGDLTGFLELVSQRQLLMDEIDRLNASLRPEPGVMRDTSSVGGHLAHDPVESTELREIMEAIRKNDEVCLRRLQGRRDELAADIRQTRANRRAADAYSQGQVIHEAWFVDKKK
jgi:hypothetical protein